MQPGDRPGAAQAVQATLELALQRFKEHRLPEAEALYRRALESVPGNADALNMLGVVLAERGNPLLALKYIDEAIRLVPASAAYLTNRGEILRRWGMLDEGLAACARAAELDPSSPEARNNHGLALLGKGRFEEAAEESRAAIALRPAMAQAHLNLGRALKALARWEDAARALADAVAADPGYAEGWFELATVEERLDDSRASVASCERALACRAEFPEALVALGDAWSSLREPEKAAQAYRRALQGSPGHAVARYQLALCLLGQGYFAEGWKLYESRCDPAIPGALTPPMMPMPMWQGEDLLGKRLLVLTEQGYGDHIQFARFVPLVARRGADVVVGASPEMRVLTATLAGVAGVVTQIEEAWQSGCDYWTYVASLPLRLGIGAGRVPAAVPYLHAEPARVAAWRDELGRHAGGPRIGLCWAGRSTHGNDWRRSIRFESLAPLAAARRDAVFVTLQTGERARDAGSPPDGMRVVACGGELRDFADTAALVANLDLLISVDSAPAHLAGALGRAVWTLLPCQPDWRWRLDDAVSRWYPTMRLYRQEHSGDWAGVIRRVAENLARAEFAAVEAAAG
ncbi:MAG: tetratricopeptide repeat protein [Burkholderiales bacterium]|nr:tetratricopeptide repeat protein [Burkholderiales bacterium]